jgi:succinate dehydrogenase hydrophobic anchor subunit
MWYWITISALCFVLLLIVEEFFYYFWNRYVYGPNIKRKRKWWSRLSLACALFMRLFHKREKKLPKSNSDKSLPL